MLILDIRIKQIEDWIEEYANNQDTVSLAETALNIHQLYRKELNLAQKMKTVWTEFEGKEELNNTRRR